MLQPTPAFSSVRLLPLVLVALAHLVAGCGASRPDIVVITLDTLRRDHVGAYGWSGPGPSPTPRLDAFAPQARVFEGALTTMPTTSPAHASLFTGLAPRDHGVLRNGDVVREGVGTRRSLPLLLKGAGYQTAAFVTARVFGPSPIGLAGFDRYEPEGPRPGSAAVAAALEWLDRRDRAPVFLWVHFYDPHAPYGSAEDKRERYPVDLRDYGWVDVERYREAERRTVMAESYAAGVRDADTAVGQLLDGLAARGLAPLLAIVADHGEFLAERLERTGFAYGHGSLLGSEVLSIPLFLAGPRIAPGRVDGAVSIMDLYTTLLHAAGIEDPDAAAEGRMDLSDQPPPGRIVAAARRAFPTQALTHRGLSAEAVSHMRAQAVAVSNGSELFIVGDDGRPLGALGPRDLALGPAAVAFLATHPGGEVGEAPTLDAETRERLRMLGYVD